MSEQLLKTPCAFGENGNFLLERELGSGGMGGVYMGRDKMLDRPVAVKVMLKEYGADADFVGKFKKEAQAAAKLIHPNIAQVYSYGISDGMPYIAMELVAGGSLWTVMQATPGKTDVTRVLKICQQVAQALQCSTDQGFVHGDIKPENILLDANGNAKLVDFGLAGMQKDTSEIWGTPYYIAPEKVRQEGVDFRADMYSLGGTLYHALTNVPPFDGDDVQAVVKARFLGVPKKPSEVRPGLTPAVDALVMRMLELDTDKRFPSIEALIEEFKRVLTSGLDRESDAGAAPQGQVAAVGTAKRATTVRGGRRVTTVRRHTASPVAKPADPDVDGQQDEEEDGGSVGMKVVGAVVGGLLLVGAVIGGLVWYKTADAKSREANHRAQVVEKISVARNSIEDKRQAALKFADEFDAFAEQAVKACTKTTVEMKRILPDWADDMQPPPSAELLAAIASTNEAAAVAVSDGASSTAAAPAAADAAQGAKDAAAQADAALKKMLDAMGKGLDKVLPGMLAQLAKKVGMDPPSADFDPKSPDAEDYLKQLQDALEKAKAEGKFKLSSEKVEAPAVEETAAEPAKQRPAVLDDVRELWDRAYGCQASAIRIRGRVNKLVKACEAAAEIKGDDEAAMTKLADLSNKAKDALDEIRGSKDVESVKKGISYINQKGDKAVGKTLNRLRIEKLEQERKEQKAKEAAEEKARLEAAAAAKAKLIEEESAAARDKFDAIVAQGVLRQLDWEGALRQLKTLKDGFKSPEGGFAADHEIHKVETMKMVQDIFRDNLPGYVFKKGGKKGSIKGNKVRKVDALMIDTVKADGKTPQKLTWVKFYKEYHGNLNELINTFVVKGRENGKKHLNLKEWADAMSGAALTMRIVCGDEPTAVAYGEKLVRQVAAVFPDYTRNLKAMFPDITVEEAAAADE